jgi:hypothetical protein
MLSEFVLAFVCGLQSPAKCLVNIQDLNSV